MFKFEIGETVWYKPGRNATNLEKVVICNRYSTMHMNMYNIGSSINVGECYLLPLDSTPEAQFEIDTLTDSAIYSKIIRNAYGGLLSSSQHDSVKQAGEYLLDMDDDEDYDPSFFRPDKVFAKWLLKRLDNKIFIDVGCGEGVLTDMLMRLGGKGMGIDIQYKPTWELKRIKFMQDRRHDGMLHLIQGDSTKSTFISSANPETAALLFCRPSHGVFVEDTIRNAPSGIDVYYITVPENISKYDDLGYYKRFVEKLDHEGSSVDGESVYYFKKP